MSTSDWAKFFESSGIPRSASAQYAVNFADHRIGMDMLLDLNKEYLRDLGVSALGDVIAILKQAKTVQGQMATAKVFSSNNDVDKKLTNRTVITSSSRIADNNKSSVKTNPSSSGPSALPSPVPLKSCRVQTPPRSEPRYEQKKVTARLGPPKPITFADIGLGPKSEKSNHSVSNPKASVSIGSSVFNRLGGSNSESPSSSTRHVVKPIHPMKAIEAPTTSSASKSAFDRLGQAKETRNVSRIGDSPPPPTLTRPTSSSSSRSLISTRPSISTRPAISSSSTRISIPHESRRRRDEDSESNYSESGDVVKDLKKRVMIKKGLMACPVRTSKTVATSGANNPRTSSKTLLLVRTLSDGTKTQERISADDPILKNVKVTKLPKMRNPEEISAVSREPRKRPRISPPPPSSNSSSISSSNKRPSLSSSTASRPSHNSSSMRSERRLSPKPLSRKRISAPGDQDRDDEVRPKISRIKSRLGPRTSL